MSLHKCSGQKVVRCNCDEKMPVASIARRILL